MTLTDESNKNWTCPYPFTLTNGVTMMTLDCVRVIVELHGKTFCPVEFGTFMAGQTTAVFTGNVFYYLDDVLRFAKGLPVVD